MTWTKEPDPWAMATPWLFAIGIALPTMLLMGHFHIFDYFASGGHWHN